MVLAWENLQEIFVIIVVVVVAVVAFYLTGGFFISLLFGVIPHPSVSYRCVFTPHFILLVLQSDTRHFHFNYSRLFIFTSSATVLNGSFLPTGIFYPTLLRLWLNAGRNAPSRIFLCTCPHRVVPSGWRMDQLTIDLSIVPVSHKV